MRGFAFCSLNVTCGISSDKRKQNCGKELYRSAKFRCMGHPLARRLAPIICLLLLTAAVVCCPALPAQAAPPVPISSEPHHQLVFQNAFVRVYQLALEPHEETLPYAVEHDCISETVQEGQPAERFDDAVGTSFSPPGKPSSYARGPFTNVWRDGTDQPYRNVTIELLYPQGAVYSECVRVSEAQDLGCHADIELGHSFFVGITGVSAQLPIFRTDEIAEFALMLFGGKQATVEMKNDALLVFDTESDVKLTTSLDKKEVSLHPGGVLWVTAGARLDVKNRSKLVDRMTAIVFPMPH